MLEAAIFQLCVFVGYVAFVWMRYGVLYSISESWYRLKSKNKWMFVAFCMLLSFPMFFHSMDFHMDVANNGDYTGLFFVSMLMGLTGVAAAFKRGGNVNAFHFTGVIFGAGGAILGLGLQYGIWFPLLLSVIWFAVVMFTEKIENIVWWIEIGVFTSIMAGILTLYV